MMRRVDRIEARAGTLVSQQIEQLLSSMPLPTTALGFAFAGLCLLIGVALVYLSRKIENC